LISDPEKVIELGRNAKYKAEKELSFALFLKKIFLIIEESSAVAGA
jgi:hypothetical protein